MRRFFVSTLLFFLLLHNHLLLAQPTAGSPVEHMNYFTKLEETLSRNMLSYSSEVAHGRRAKKMEKRRMELIASMSEALREAGKQRPYKGDASLRDAYKEYWSVLLTVFKEDYSKIVDMEEVAERSYDDMEAYLMIKEKASEKMKEASSKIPLMYSAFAARHGVTLSEGQSSKLSKRLEKAGKVSSYYNKIYLLYFKSNFQEGAMIKAMGKNDVNGIEQSRNSLVKFSSEGLAHLDTIKTFENDGSLIQACRRILQFQKNEGESKAAYMTDFLIKKEDFEKSKKLFDAKPAGKVTQAEIDVYNKAIKDYNGAINAYNKANTELNESRTKAEEAWNAAQKKFLDEHTPYKL